MKVMAMASKIRFPRHGMRVSEMLSRPIENRLLAYAVVTAGAVALTTPASASVVFTKTHITFDHGFLNIDLNHDGSPDFTLHNFSFGTSSTVRVITVKGGSSAAGVITSAKSSHWAYRLPRNYPIGTGVVQSFRYQNVYIPSGTPFRLQNKFLGLRFKINGQFHYGWARIATRGNFFSHLTLQLTGFAYETQPDKTILAGDTGSGVTDASAANETELDSGQPSLGVLSLGSRGLNAWRPRKPVAPQSVQTTE